MPLLLVTLHAGALVLAGLGPEGAENDAEVVAAGDEAMIDLEITIDGLRARIGAVADEWRIEVDEGDDNSVVARLRRDDGVELERRLELRGESVEERSRELATALAFVIDEAETSEPEPELELEPEPEPEPEPAPNPGDSGEDAPRLRGWFGVGPRLGVGSPRAADFDAGVDLLGGLELLGGVLHPLFHVGWTTSREASLVGNYAHLGAGLAAGAGLLKDRLWVGGGVIPRAIWLRLREEERRAAAWTAGGDAVAIGHFRAPVGERLELQVSARVGVDVTLPPLVLAGSTARLMRGDLRFVGGASIGLRW